MPRRLLASALVTLGVLLAGCSDPEADRQPGDPVTAEEADVLAGLLARDTEEGGADVVVTAPFGEGGLLTLTGEVDFAGSAGRAQAVTDYGDERPDDVRTLFFTREQIWFGDVPGLSDALAAAGLPDAPFVRRPVATGPDAVPLTDVLVTVLLNLGAAEADDAAAFRGGEHTWEGQRSIDRRLATVYAGEAGWSVAVDDTSDLLLQYVTPLPGQDADVTVTLSDHGPRTIALPEDGQTVDAAAHPEVSAAVGV
ncbi:hypothetical protein SAMN05660657_04514 [Geodermatophilus amargosae]|uniref:Lipoprotein n=1 Tax=Geodermatophilus amargosae TaxID=1296565 RepID=A0A1I7CIL0_9ACTN|nr:hypothetical protein [Geodermatophilus amargosae]SFT99214.1 hypothetical protein SAMN05660657_04514 [Geodermatophilus amargosae]